MRRLLPFALLIAALTACNANNEPAGTGPVPAGTTGSNTAGPGIPSPGIPSPGTATSGTASPGTASPGTADPTGKAGPAGSIAPASAVPPAATLQLSDSAPWNHLASAHTGLAAIEQTEPSACAARTAFPSDKARLAARTVGYDMQPAHEAGGAYEAVVTYRAGGAQQALAEARRVLAACHRYVHTLPQGTKTTKSYTLERMLPGVGDEALLIRQDDVNAGETRVWRRYITVVRVGSAVLTTIHELGEGTATADVAIRLAKAGAVRARCLPAC